jgi:acylphosphatase
MAKACCHLLISGRVQGVCFRVYSQKAAVLLGLTGWVRNLQDGRVELLACGEGKILNRFIVWLADGVVEARVDDILKKTLEIQDFENFEILQDA